MSSPLPTTLILKKMGPARWARLGEQRTGPERPFVRYEIVEKISHPNFKLPSVYNDIALYKLDRDVQFSPFIRPICLQPDHQSSNISAIATSWDINYDGELLDSLHEFHMDIKQCNETLPLSTSMKFRLKDGDMEDFIVCASRRYCARPSIVPGSPLQLKLKNPYCMYSQVGVASIASFGKGCVGEDDLVVYTRISHFLPWIQSIVWP
ncbi:serine protease snake-like isoform X1 [Homalodisca vitripennis]|uniref:serine protease snake-like isoform X1 n=1 Tax=Homalodisca vitripennis TaxID=197043 RepID=UPI001EEA2EFD|nr:serine protease snake-like isoform X1 [Homalodisca vitripennis]